MSVFSGVSIDDGNDRIHKDFINFHGLVLSMTPAATGKLQSRIAQDVLYQLRLNVQRSKNAIVVAHFEDKPTSQDSSETAHNPRSRSGCLSDSADLKCPPLCAALAGLRRELQIWAEGRVTFSGEPVTFTLTFCLFGFRFRLA